MLLDLVLDLLGGALRNLTFVKVFINIFLILIVLDEHFIIFGAREVQFLGSRQVEAMLRDREKDEAKEYHDHLGDTTEVS